MKRRLKMVTIALTLVAVIAFALTSVAFAAGPQNSSDSCYPWEDDAGFGEMGDGECDGECDGGEQYGAGPEGSGWGEQGSGMGPNK
jgi:hypothetical protein